MAEKPTFDMMLRCPAAYRAQLKLKGYGRALAAGIPADQAARMCGLSPEEVAGASRFFRKVGRAGKGLGRTLGRGARLVARYNPATLSLKYAGKGLAAATAGLRRKIFRALFKKIIDRRARLISWQERGSLQPSASDRQKAQRWAVAYVKRRGILGKLMGTALSGAEPISATLLTISIPVLLAFARKALKVAEGQGAPADPRAVAAPGPASAPPEMPESSLPPDDGA